MNFNQFRNLGQRFGFGVPGGNGGITAGFGFFPGLFGLHLVNFIKTFEFNSGDREHS